MGIGGVQEIQLSPGKRRARRRCGILCIGLHTADVPGQDNIALRMLTALACKSSASVQPEKGNSWRIRAHLGGVMGRRYTKILPFHKQTNELAKLSNR